MIFVRVQNSPDSRQCDNKIRSFPKESGAEKKTKSGCTIAHGFVHHIRFLDLLQPLLASADPCDNVGHSKQREKKSSRDRPSDRCTMNIKENRQVREQKREKKKGACQARAIHFSARERYPPPTSSLARQDADRLCRASRERRPVLLILYLCALLFSLCSAIREAIAIRALKIRSVPS